MSDSPINRAVAIQTRMRERRQAEAEDRKALREAVLACIEDRYRPSVIARTLGVSQSRLDQIRNGR